MSKVLAIGWANLVRFFRDRSNYFFALVLPLGLILLIGMSFGAQSSVRVGVVGTGEVADAFVAALAGSAGLEVLRPAGADALKDDVERGELTLGVVLPSDLDAALADGAGATAELYGGASGSGQAYTFELMAAADAAAAPALAAAYLARRYSEPLEGAFAAIEAAAAATPPIELVAVGEGAAVDTAAPLALVAAAELVLFMFLTGLTSATSLIDSRKLGVSRRMLATPTSAAQIVLGEGFGRFLVTLFQGVYIVGGSALLFGVAWGEPLPVLVLLVCFAAVAAAAGTLLGSVFSSSQQAAGVGVMAGLVMAAVGGCMVPLYLFGPTMRAVARAVPHSWAVAGFETLMRQSGGLGGVVPNLAVLALFAVALFALAAWRLRAALTRG